METTIFGKKDIILKKATLLFTKYGTQSLSMDDIANECGVSKRTVYKYFQNKADLINQIIGIKITRFQENLEDITMKSKNAVVELHWFFMYYKEVISSYSPTFLRDLKRSELIFYVKYSNINNEIILPFFLKNIKRGQLEGLYKQDLDQEEMSQSVLNMLSYIFSENSLAHIENTYGTLDFFGKLLMHRLVTVGGLDELNAQNS
ncbi:TetR/AcrR family transcriptional regulator [Maribacter sp. TH_r10]|uniref:TetR/AcrR family transcriptional regulator n=1 Tax=Maribacter sp. TH_r10 TaxID=3082086 RepID=UPI002952AB36|nr:TetR/AcrR family transcriptional regulator [Maribacter sp. TH_r10]MDV7138306.1 TetR/AcrR family transcriptional regulator [Maribacter sp. TH_r10]